MKSKLPIIVVCLFCLPIFLRGQNPETLFKNGMAQYDNGQYAEAANTFIKISSQKFNLFTTPSIYMTGMAYMKSGEEEGAISKFTFLVNAYSSSTYVDEANYHKSMLMLKKKESQKGAIYTLTKLMDETGNDQLQKDALNLYKNFLFEKADAEFLKDYYTYVKQAYKETVLEALCWRLYQGKAVEQMNKYLEEYKKTSGGKLSERLSRFLAVEAPKANDGALKIAVMLPFQAKMQDSTLNIPAKTSVELMEGMRMAVENEVYPKIPNFEIKFFDTRKDPDETSRLLREDVKTFSPDIIIGEVFNAPSKLIGDYAERNKVLQIVPLSPSLDLIQNKKQVFLANPSVKTQTEALAKYADDKLQLKKYLVINDYTPVSRSQSGFFAEYLKAQGKNVVVRTVGSSDAAGKEQLKSIANEIKNEGYEAVFMPTADEQLVTVALGFLNRDSLMVQVFGVSDWADFQQIDRLLLSKFNSKFADVFNSENDASAYSQFSTNFLAVNKHKPSTYAVQGYDLMRFILTNYAQAAGLLDLMRKSKPFRGAGQNFYFNQANDNQSVQMMQFEEYDIVKVRTW